MLTNMKQNSNQPKTDFRSIEQKKSVDFEKAPIVIHTPNPYDGVIHQ